MVMWTYKIGDAVQITFNVDENKVDVNEFKETMKEIAETEIKGYLALEKMKHKLKVVETNHGNT